MLEEDVVLGRWAGAAVRTLAVCSAAEGNQLGASGPSGEYLGSEPVEGRVAEEEVVLEEVRRPLRRLGPAMKGPEERVGSDICMCRFSSL